MVMDEFSPVRSLPDYPRIKKLAAALYRLDASPHGAAIMIGSGFSRCAARHVDAMKKMPLWNEFTRSLIRDLYPDQESLHFTDPLRVAEEYRAFFGQAALNDRIRHEIADDSWTTGPLYRSLLQLPWSEVLTTNWDTLLERAASELHSPYYTRVTKTSDLAWAQSPRIVKLHGTIGVTDTFIVAQEDYRTYPERFAPFVNMARQVFIENELCLLGFSGDDPNFLQWAGWVRDHLADHARKIYLVGALNLSAARRKQLESINVAPVDLWPAVAGITDADLRHKTATELFLQAMLDESKSWTEQHEWKPTLLSKGFATIEEHTRALNDPAYGASLLASQLENLGRDRESYPGWVICPPSLRWQLTNQLSSPYPNPKNLEALTADNRAWLLYEIAWRKAVTCEYIQPWLADALFEVADPDTPCVLTKRQQLEIAVVLLNNTRWPLVDNEDDQQILDARAQALIGILEKYASYLPDCEAEVAYYRAFVARDRLDYVGLATRVESVLGEDPIWKLRRAALLIELGRLTEAGQLVVQAFRELRDHHRRDRHSIAILSRLLWAHWLLQAAQWSSVGQAPEALPAFAEGIYRKWKCDPWSWLDDLRNTLDKRRETYSARQSPVEPLFAQGHYRDRGGNDSGNNEVSDFFLLDGLSRTVGIPLRVGGWSGVSLLASDVESMLRYGGTGVDFWDYLLAIRSASSDDDMVIKSVFTRIGVARANQKFVETLVSRLVAVIAYWRKELPSSSEDRRGYALSKLRVFLEILARLAVRVSPAKAKDLFRLAMSIGQQPELRHHWMFTALDDLVTHALKSIPDPEQGDLLAEALAFPLQGEVMSSDFPYWPNPVIDHPNDRRSDRDLDANVARLIEAAASGSTKSKRDSLLRLLPLATKANFLTSTESKQLAVAIWGESPEYQSLPETGLLPHALLLLPVMDAVRATALIRAHLYDHCADILKATQIEVRVIPSPEITRAIETCNSIANAAANQTTHLLPTPAQAVALFDHMTKWRPPAATKGSFQLGLSFGKQLAQSIGNALSYGIVPALDAETKTADRLQGLRAFYSDVEGSQATLPCFVYFAATNDAFSKVVEETIRTALRSRDSAKVGYAAIALRQWVDLEGSNVSDEVERLIATTLSIVESGYSSGLAQIIWLMGGLLGAQRLSEQQRNTLSEAIPNIFEATDYGNIDANSLEAVSASTIRAACVRVMHALQQTFPDKQRLNDLLTKAREDPLPEVRFALHSSG